MNQQNQNLETSRHAHILRTLIFIESLVDHNLLFIKNSSRKDSWPNKLNGVGGHVEFNETILYAAQRELREETGLQIPSLNLKGTITITPSQKNTSITLFVFHGTSPTDIVNASPEGELLWLDPALIDKNNAVPDLPDILRRIPPLNTTQTFFWAHYRYNKEDELIASFIDT